MKQETIDEIIDKLTLMDDDFMTAVFNDNIEDTQFVLRILLDKPDLEVTKVIVQRELRNLKGRSVRMDVWAQDSEGKQYDIEVQRDDEGAAPERARYNSSLLDGSAVKKKAEFKDLPETYIIFITENDVLSAGLSLYHIERIVTETGETFDDKEHIIYANASTTEDSDVGRLMHDFRQNDPDKMYFSQLAKTTRSFKREGGRESMCQLIKDAVQDAMKEERKEYITQGVVASIKKLLKKMTPDEVLDLGFSKEEIALAQNSLLTKVSN